MQQQTQANSNAQMNGLLTSLTQTSGNSNLPTSIMKLPEAERQNWLTQYLSQLRRGANAQLAASESNIKVPSSSNAPMVVKSIQNEPPSEGSTSK